MRWREREIYIYIYENRHTHMFIYIYIYIYIYTCCGRTCISTCRRAQLRRHLPWLRLPSLAAKTGVALSNGHRYRGIWGHFLCKTQHVNNGSMVIVQQLIVLAAWIFDQLNLFIVLRKQGWLFNNVNSYNSSHFIVALHSTMSTATWVALYRKTCDCLVVWNIFYFSIYWE